MKKSAIVTASLALGITAATAATQTKNTFISYFTPQNVKSLMTYIQAKQVNGFIMWEFRGDMPYGDPRSLLSAAVKNYKIDKTNPPIFMGYWSDWDVYSADPTGRAIPQPAYAITGSLDSTGKTVENSDLDAKLAGMNVVTYAFIEAQAKTYNDQGTVKTNPNYDKDGGTLYFNDPWADLQKGDSFCTGGNTAICSYVPTMQGKTLADSEKMGNFSAFANLKHSDSSNPLGPLKKVFSVGGYGHNDTFEDAFDSDAHIQNFVNSAAAIITNYKLDGIDLDYENPQMTLAQSQQYQKLVDALSAKLAPLHKQIYVAILANPEYIDGTEAKNTVGFAKGVLSDIQSKVTSINLMTYDFHGAFDYKPDGSGKTGFLTNLGLQNNTSPDAFSVKNAVNAATTAGVPDNKLTVGIPAYGRALQGISSANAGLGQTITNTPIPQGELDAKNCDTDITNIGPKSCSGSYEYSYINKNMIGKGFSETIAPDPYDATTAYAASWSPAGNGNYKLDISDTGKTAEGDLGVQVKVVGSNASEDFGPSDYLGPGAPDKVYTKATNPSTSEINGDSSLTVDWITYAGGPTGSCKQKLNLTSNMHVMVKVDKTGNGVCSIEKLPS